MVDYPILCHTLLPDNKEIVLFNLSDIHLAQKIIDLGKYRFMAFVGWDSSTFEARIGILAQNSHDEQDVVLVWIILSHPYVKV